MISAMVSLRSQVTRDHLCRRAAPPTFLVGHAHDIALRARDAVIGAGSTQRADAVLRVVKPIRNETLANRRGSAVLGKRTSSNCTPVEATEDRRDC
jgi:hypothetical protein